MKHIVFDCDNTFGVKDCDVDDGLALLYLLGCPEATVHGITATYGNNRVDVVYRTTQRMLEELGRTDIPLKPGTMRVRRRIISRRWLHGMRESCPFLQLDP